MIYVHQGTFLICDLCAWNNIIALKLPEEEFMYLAQYLTQYYATLGRKRKVDSW